VLSQNVIEDSFGEGKVRLCGEIARSGSQLASLDLPTNKKGFCSEPLQSDQKESHSSFSEG
jgi:hypothetical protein